MLRVVVEVPRFYAFGLVCSVESLADAFGLVWAARNSLQCGDGANFDYFGADAAVSRPRAVFDERFERPHGAGAGGSGFGGGT